jgi:hypothetical protein
MAGRTTPGGFVPGLIQRWLEKRSTRVHCLPRSTRIASPTHALAAVNGSTTTHLA